MCVCRLRHAKLFTMLYFMADPAEKHSTGTHTRIQAHGLTRSNSIYRFKERKQRNRRMCCTEKLDGNILTFTTEQDRIG